MIDHRYCKPGDIVLYSSPSGKRSHVGVVIDAGHGSSCQVSFWNIHLNQFYPTPSLILEDKLTKIGSVENWEKGIFENV